MKLKGKILWLFLENYHRFIETKHTQHIYFMVRRQWDKTFCKMFKGKLIKELKRRQTYALNNRCLQFCIYTDSINFIFLSFDYICSSDTRSFCLLIYFCYSFLSYLISSLWYKNSFINNLYLCQVQKQRFFLILPVLSFTVTLSLSISFLFVLVLQSKAVLCANVV